VPAQPETGTPSTTDLTATGEATAIGTEVVTPPKPARPKRPAPAPDDWKKGIGIFGGG
jgi:hypothetical protein